MNIQELETKEIETLIVQLNTELDARIKEKKDKFITEIRDRADELGISTDDLLQAVGKTNKRKTNAKVKYRNPDNEAQTWTGKGRKPNWVLSHLEGGKQLEDMLIS